MVIDNNSVLHTNTYSVYNYKNTLNVSTLFNFFFNFGLGITFLLLFYF
jgi:hypothetical protein